MMKDIKAGLNNVQMFEKYPSTWSRRHRVLKEYRKDVAPRRKKMATITTFFGDTGCGKSHVAHARALILEERYGVLVITSKGQVAWMDGCGDGVKVVVFDDFEGEISYRAILKLFDKYPCVAPVKYSTANIVWEHVFITSNIHPKMWYPDREWEGGPLQRRLTEGGSTITEMNERYKEPIRRMYPMIEDAQRTADLPMIEDTEVLYDTEADRGSEISLD